jgi:hypothetical protein
MKNKKFILLTLLVISLAAFLLSSCGSGGSGGTAQSESGSAGTGSVAIVLTDNFTDEFSKIIVTITKIELLSATGKYTIFSGSRKFDFLNLRNETTLMVIEGSVPAMWYEKIRLTVEDVTLYDEFGQKIDEEVDLTGNHKIDLNPRKDFYVATGKMLTIQLDLDAKNSLIKQNPNRYKFDPVVFVEITGDIPPSKLMRVPGIIHERDASAGEFTLCFIRDDVSVMDYDYGSCITVSVSRNTSIFDAATNGRPASFVDLAVRDHVTAIGFFSRALCAQYDEQDSCKVLDAAVVEIGEFEKIKGTVITPVDMTTTPYEFELQRHPGQLPLVAGDKIKVLLQTSAKIYSVKDGQMVDPSLLIRGDAVEIDGIYLFPSDPAAEPYAINAVFMLVDLAKKLSGIITEIRDSSKTFDLNVGSVTSPIIYCVQVPEYAQIYLVNNLRNSSDIIDILGLSPEMRADVYGYEYDTSGSGCLKAETIIAFE